MQIVASQRNGIVDQASIRRPPGLPGVETLSAHYLRQNFKPHAHDEYVLGVIEGGVHSVWCRGELNHAPAGTVVTMRPGDVHHGGSGSEVGWRQRMLYVSEAGMRDILADIADRDTVAPLDFRAAFHRQRGLARQFVNLHEMLHGGASALAQDVALDELVRTVTSALAPGPAPQGRFAPDGRIADAIEYLREQVEEDVRLEELCVRAGLRRRQVIEAFRRHTGLPPHAWHIQQKIARVRTLLREGMPATQAAAQLGFADQSHMARHFVAIVGVTPGAYARG